MSIINSTYFDNHENITIFTDNSLGLQAIIAIHDTTLGPAIGGTRFLHYQNEQEAIDDALRLSQGMTYKAALADVPMGGGKAVIMADPKMHKSPELLLSYAQQLNLLQGRFLTGEDVGIGAADIEIMANATPYVKGTLQDQCGDPSPVTAYGVLQGMKAAQQALTGNNSLQGKTVAIQGLGKVGFALAKLLQSESINVVACDIDRTRAYTAQQQLGVKIVDPEAIYDTKADIFAPCGLGSVLNSQTVPRLKARIIAGSANNQLADAEVGRQLQVRKILYAPDYVINAGGLINVYYAGADYDRNQVLRKVDGIYQTLSQIFQSSQLFEVPINLVADQMAQERLKKGFGNLNVG